MTSMWQSRCCWKMLLVVPTRNDRVLSRSICCSGRYGWKNEPCASGEVKVSVQPCDTDCPPQGRAEGPRDPGTPRGECSDRRTLPKMLSGRPKYLIRLYLSLVLKLVGFVNRRERLSSSGEAASSRAVRRAEGQAVVRSGQHTFCGGCRGGGRGGRTGDEGHEAVLKGCELLDGRVGREEHDLRGTRRGRA